MEAVDVLAVVDGLDDFLFGDMAGKRELHDEAVDLRVLIETLDGFEKFLFGHVILVADKGRAESAGLAGFYFVGHIGFAAAVVADKDGCEMGAAFALCHHFFDFRGNLAFDVVSSLFSVNEGHNFMSIC